MSDFIRDIIMRIMGSHIGRENAIRKRAIIPQLAIYNVTDERYVRDVLASLPLCTCPEGWFTPDYRNIPKGTAEVLEFKRFLSEGAGGPKTAYKRCAIIYSYYRMLIPPACQQSLDFGGAA
ncbi:MAG: hypothetical protein ACYDH3_00090 [Candidatus Aminicenantales bacterium]